MVSTNTITLNSNRDLEPHSSCSSLNQTQSPSVHIPSFLSSQQSHGTPSGECVFCCEDLTSDNYVEYRAAPSALWYPSVYCQLCLESQFIEKQFQTYLENIAKADCAAALKRVITNPPPINVKDPGLPCTEEQGGGVEGGDERGNGEVEKFWFLSDGKEHSAKLKGSLLGEERDKFWAEKKEFLTATEEEEERLKKEGGGGGAGEAEGVK